MDRRRSVIHRDQSPLFGTHVIHGLTDKFNHHRVKVYNLHLFRDSRSVFCTQPLPHTLKHAHAERVRERERCDSDTTVSDNASTDGYTHTHTQNYVKIPVLASILVNAVGYVIS